MNCQEFVDFLMEYLEGTLDPTQSETFEEHMVECPECVTYLETYQQTIRLGKDLLCDQGDVIPSDVPEDLVRAIMIARGAMSVPKDSPGLFARLAACLREMLGRS
jgi:anti-sigma factor RsiW